MAYVAQTYIVLIASPSDVSEEREAAKQAIHEWNALNARAEGVTLDPHMWETHATPGFGRPQEIINNQLVKNADLLVGMFWTKIGTPTGVAASGTVEEIQQVVAAGKPAMLYFSKCPLPSDVDLKQLKKLREFKSEMRTKAIVGDFNSPDDLRQTLKDDLTRRVRELKAAHVAPHTSGDRLYAMMDRVEAAGREIETEEAAGRKRAAEEHSAFVKRLEQNDFGSVRPYRSLALSIIPVLPLEPTLDLSLMEQAMIMWMRPIIEVQGMNDFRNTQNSYMTMLRIAGAGPKDPPVGACELTDDGSFFTACDMVDRFVLLGNPKSNGAVFQHPGADKDDDIIFFHDVQLKVVNKVVTYAKRMQESEIDRPLIVRLSLVGVGGVKLLVNGAIVNAKPPQKLMFRE